MKLENQDNSSSKFDHVFKVEGMDCAEEVAILKRELSSIVGGEEYLFFDLLNAKLSIKGSEKTFKQLEVIAAIKKTGMRAIPWGAPIEEKNFLNDMEG